MASSEHIGLIRCAHCGNHNATVHRQTKGTKKGRLYYRCYTEINGKVQKCGTVQIIGPAGQEYINANMRPLESGPVPDREPAPAPVSAENQIDFVQEQEEEPEPTPVPVADPKPAPRKKSLMQWLTEDDDDA